MKEIKEMSVQCVYSVGFGGYKVTNDVMAGLEKIQEMGSISIEDVELKHNKGSKEDAQILAAFEWLTHRVSEDDACMLEYELLDLQ